MSKRTHVSLQKADLVYQLAERRDSIKFEPEPNLVLLVRNSVAANTFRSFRRKRNRRGPAEVFRGWAYEWLSEESCLHELRNVSTSDGYDKWINRLAKRLRLRWRKQLGSAMPFGVSLKLTNLLLKELVRWSGFSNHEREALVELLHVPLDSYSLAAIRSSIVETVAAKSLKIPKNATMGFVKDAATYRALQTAIREIAAEAGVPPIHVDFLAWNAAHEAS